MEITNIWLDESVNECTGCGACNAMAPRVFTEGTGVYETKIVVDTTMIWSHHNNDLEKAIDRCPFNVIRCERGFNPAFDDRNILIGSSIRVDKLENVPNVRLAVLDQTNIVIVGLTTEQWDFFRECEPSIDGANKILTHIGALYAAVDGDVVLVIGNFEPPRVAAVCGNSYVGVVRVKAPFGWRIIITEDDMTVKTTGYGYVNKVI